MVPFCVFFMTLFLIFLCVMHGLLGLFEYEYYVASIILFGIFSFLFILWIAGFCSLVFADGGSMEVEQKYYKSAFAIRCHHCGVMKPLRAHHCSKCDKCFARMDHHCDALGVCIALRNNKIFVVFLVYSIGMLFIYAGSCGAMIFIDEWKSFPYILLMDVLTGGTLGIILCVLLGAQIYHILIGQTGLEFKFGIQGMEKDKTKWQRWIGVFGPPSVLWLLPTPLGFEDGSPFAWEHLRGKDEGSHVKQD